MRILLAHNSTYYPAHGGGDKSNRLLIEALAGEGHECRVVARVGGAGPEEHAKLIGELNERNVAIESDQDGIVGFRLNGIEVRTSTGSRNLRGYFASELASFCPQVILTSTDDPAQLLLEAALRDPEARVVYLARATLALPFGPDCAFPSAPKTAVLRQCDGIVGVSEYVAKYVRQYGRMDAISLPISLQGRGPFADLGRFDNEFIAMVNPCAVKGLPIFLALAEALPEQKFAAVPTWGTSDEDLAALRAHSNVTVLPPVDNIDLLLARTRVLLVPSLWAEARSRIVVEAMLRSVPVLASDVGGIPEAKMGVPYLLPVRPIEKYRPQLDAQMVPVAEVPPQDVRPWLNALREVVTDRARYAEVSAASRQAALAYVDSISVKPFEAYLDSLTRQPQKSREAVTAPPALSEDKRKLLALRLRKKAAGEWFPGIDQTGEARLRLFCFPYAGAGASAFAGWAKSLPAEVAVCPVRPPGRETRASEPPFDNMADLIGALAEAIAPHLTVPYAFFGHSMGAGVAFELTRTLREKRLPLPQTLLVSGARAPHFREQYTPGPEPTDEQLIAQLPALQEAGEAAIRLLLPLLRADTRLYRQYRYTPGPLLAMPIHAYGGLDDPAVPTEWVEAWRRETTAEASVQLFAGGHFFLQTSREEFLAAVREALVPLLSSAVP